MNNRIKEEINYELKASNEKKIELRVENGKINFLLNNVKFHEEFAVGSLENLTQKEFVKKHHNEYILNGIKIQLIELYNGLIIQIGKVGISIYKNISEFRSITSKIGKKMDMVFYTF